MDVTLVARDLLARLFELEHLIPRGTALMLSGGVDSSLLLACYKDRVIPYSVGYPGSQDLGVSSRLCTDLGKELHILEASDESVKKAANLVLEVDNGMNFTELGYETTLYFTLSHIEENFVMSGQGSDEIFYGYSKFVDGREETNHSSLKMLKERTIPREQKISATLGKQLFLPYLMGGIPETFRDLPRDKHISDGVGKVIVREACRLAGLPSYIYLRPKKAAQYGSGFNRYLQKEFRGRLDR